MIKFISFILFLIIPFPLKAEEAKLYDLKIKLKPKVVESCVYWQGRKKVDWQEEIKNWHLGLPEKGNLPPSLFLEKIKITEDNDQRVSILPDSNVLKILSTDSFVISRSLDIDLEEYPLFNLDAEIGKAELFIYLGIDYNMDGLIDDYLSLDMPGEYNLLDLAEEKYKEFNYEYGLKLKNIVLFFNLSENSRKENSVGNVSFILREASFYNEHSLVISEAEKYPYPLKSKENKLNFLKQIKEINPSLVRIDDLVLKLKDFELPEEFKDWERTVLIKKIKLSRGKHKYEKIENPTFDIEWVIFEPVAVSQKQEIRSEPTITFKKINPTKYLVKVEGAKQPFWLVFSESFYKEWRLYRYQKSNIKNQNYFEEIVADYPKLGVKEATHLMKFTPSDIRFLFEKPLDAEHQLVNGYANGWYIEPKKIGLGENFVLAIYFWPQSLFYLGLGISGLTFLGCIVYLIWPRKRRVKKIPDTGYQIPVGGKNGV